MEINVSGVQLSHKETRLFWKKKNKYVNVLKSSDDARAIARISFLSKKLAKLDTIANLKLSLFHSLRTWKKKEMEKEGTGKPPGRQAPLPSCPHSPAQSSLPALGPAFK